ncbi:MAG TPA: hypothetical protein VJ302_29100, partial [Blastocatellia bacterium]|nr:hypothetical protein [Blastocatellia bacterium]
MINRKILTPLLWGAAVLCGSLAAGCTRPQSISKFDAKSEAAPERSGPAMISPPQPAEVREKIARVYRQTVEVYTEDGLHCFSGDFNGDSSADLAVEVTPAAGRLDQINSELANWLISDPHAAAAARRSVQVERREILLAVIHGYGPLGWRDSEARQAYLLKNAVGEQMELQSPAGLEAATNRRMFHGDVVKERVAGEEGFLYWTEGRY